MPPVIPLGLIVNPAARQVRRRPTGAASVWRGHLPEESVRVTRSLEELDQAIAAFRSAGARVVATLGGDGSLHHLVDALLRHYDEAGAPIVLALAGGTMNGVARSLGTGGSPERLLGATLAALAGGGSPSFRLRFLLQVDDVADGRTRYGFGFATGSVFHAYEEYYRDPDPGLRAAIRASLLPVRAAVLGEDLGGGERLEVQVDGVPALAEPPHSLVACVTENPFLWFRPFGAPLGDAPGFHLASLAMTPREIAPRLWSIFRGRCRHPRLRISQARAVTVRTGTGYVLDGDLYRPGGRSDLRLTVGPRLRFVDPSAEGVPASPFLPRRGA